MPTLKIHYHHTDDCTPQKIFVNGKKEKKLKFEIAEGEPVKIQILNKIQSKKDQFYFVLGDFDEYNEFKEYFYRYLCCFKKEDK